VICKDRHQRSMNGGPTIPESVVKILDRVLEQVWWIDGNGSIRV